jgi:hypothetical protein
MKIRTKKQNADGIVRLETSGELKEIIINEDLLKPKEASISLCFRGKDSSGIVELTQREIKILNKEISEKLPENIKIMKFEK